MKHRFDEFGGEFNGLNSPPILLKNSFSSIDEKIPGVIGSEARFRLGGIHERVGVAVSDLLNGL